MIFAVITHVQHKTYNNHIYAFAPYVREMNIWFKYIENPLLIAPIEVEKPTLIDIPYNKKVEFLEVPSFSIVSLRESFKTLIKLPKILWQIFRGIQKADHIHLRLPGNMGLLGSIIQIFFPNKPKTVKYAGNWDPNIKEPWSYKLQKRIVNNPFLSRNMKVLVYGEWDNMSKNIVPFFTATYHENEIFEIPPLPLNKPVKLLFVGSLSPKKQPLLSIKTLEELEKRGISAELEIIGDGKLKVELEDYIKKNNLQNKVYLAGLKSKKEVAESMRNAHFLVFLTVNEEGWPKVVAESMIWKTLPITTPISAVPYMLGYGERGSLIEPDPVKAADEIEYYLKNPGIYYEKVNKAHNWSKQYTLEKFEEEIKKLLESFEK